MQVIKEIELLPPLELGLLNGWILLLIQSLVTGILLALVPRDVFRRLTDRSDFNRVQKVQLILSKVIAICYIIVIFLTPLKIGSYEFILGSFFLALGLCGLVLAVINFKNTPYDKPVTQGIYKISRHPQIVMQFISMVGISLAVGSWIALILLIMSKIPGHFTILAEEEACLKNYGDSYREYMKRIPRYFLFF